MSIFDDEISLDVKRKMASRFFEENDEQEDEEVVDEEEDNKGKADEEDVDKEDEEKEEEEDEDDNEKIKKLQVDISKVPKLIEKNLDSFVCSKSMKLFERFNLSTE